MYNYVKSLLCGQGDTIAEEKIVMINVSVIGATGYVGEELLRLLHKHPEVTVASAISKSFAGKKLSEVYASFRPSADLVLEDLDIEKVAAACDAAFLCLPHTQSFQVAPALLEKGIKVVDLSADFRYDNVDTYEEWYGVKHTAPELLEEAVYGLPEYYRERIKQARMLANPGCYTTASILALAPLLKYGLIHPEGIVIDAKSGVSGAGRKADLGYAYCETTDNFKAYAVARHRHTSEIEERLGLLSGEEITLLFTPHLLPTKRGILATAYAQLGSGVTEQQLAQAYRSEYQEEPFVHVLEKGALPELKHVVGSNNCVIGYEVSPRTGRVIVVSCLDNLVKGAAGQALQNFNIMYGLDEKMGVPDVAWYL